MRVVPVIIRLIHHKNGFSRWLNPILFQKGDNIITAEQLR